MIDDWHLSGDNTSQKIVNNAFSHYKIHFICQKFVHTATYNYEEAKEPLKNKPVEPVSNLLQYQLVYYHNEYEKNVFIS